MIAVTGSTGQLGRLVVQELVGRVGAGQVVALARSVDKAREVLPAGVQVRRADYADAASLDAALHDVDKLLLISSSEVGQRVPQHQAVVDAARRAGVNFIAYTSLLHADSSPLALGNEHVATEAAVRASGIPFALLRNGWYTENYAQALPGAVERGVLAGCAGDGRIASASRSDYAAAAAAVLTQEGMAGKVFELAGDEAYTLAEFAAEAARRSGRPVSYQNLAEPAYKALLVQAGLPEAVSDLLADSDAGAAKGGLFDEGHALSGLIGRPTTPYAEVVRRFVA
ncbi:Quinone oxidoreductase 2 [Pigmentiphaga humi]|uniref:Quinone oxidoreductase 2 n=1 Tax=Pigmentiphaga humi TaxID=2478468 RepID=A0A3P4B428_9BURK|nr:NmrA family NAD(P)-binding protein [Pigmentiphaga humi]VCU70286.1 Quinone oxidoreductase 2 [Pigmentiphaga humi]